MGLLAKLGKRLLGIGTKKPSESIIGRVLDRVVPDKNKRNELMLEIEKEFNKQEFELDHMFMDVVKDAQKMYEFEPKIGLFLKGSTRWIIALVMTGFYIYLRITDQGITEFDQYLIGGIWGFLFILRSTEKILKRDK